MGVQGNGTKQYSVTTDANGLTEGGSRFTRVRLTASCDCELIMDGTCADGFSGGGGGGPTLQFASTHTVTHGGWGGVGASSFTCHYQYLYQYHARGRRSPVADHRSPLAPSVITPHSSLLTPHSSLAHPSSQ